MNELFCKAALCGDKTKAQELAAAYSTTDLLRWARSNKIDAAVCDVLDLENDNEDRVVRLVHAAEQVLNQAQVPHLAIEAGAVLLSSKLPFGAYGSGDIDLMVPSVEMPTLTKALQDHGFSEVHRDGRVETCRTEWQRDDLYLEISSEVYFRSVFPLPTDNPLERWLDRTHPSARAPGIHVPSPEDLLCQVAVHTSLHHYRASPGARLHIDVHRMVTDNSIDWHRFVDEAKRSKLTTRIWTSLVCAERYLGTQIPTWVTGRLQPSGRRRAMIRRLVHDIYPLAENPLTTSNLLLVDLLTDDRGKRAWATSWAGAVANKLTQKLG